MQFFILLFFFSNNGERHRERSVHHEAEITNVTNVLSISLRQLTTNESRTTGIHTGLLATGD
jgi:hypothetical protein